MQSLYPIKDKQEWMHFAAYSNGLARLNAVKSCNKCCIIYM